MNGDKSYKREVERFKYAITRTWSNERFLESVNKTIISTIQHHRRRFNANTDMQESLLHHPDDEGIDTLLHPSEHPLSPRDPAESEHLPNLITEPFIDQPQPEHPERPLHEQYKPDKQWIYSFPSAWEQSLSWFDDAGIAFLQRPLNTWARLPVIGFALALTVFTSIEFGLILPFTLYLTRYDSLADRATWLTLILSLFSQLPKRFVWRARPWMQQRAIKVRKDKTSSFPSRAVTCAIVYGVLISAALSSTNESDSINWLITIIISLVFATLASMARVIVGAHYPSDCVVGFISGTICSAIGTGLYALQTSVCAPCIVSAHITQTRSCYADSDAETLSAANPGVAWMSILVGLLVASVWLFTMVTPPLKFWTKASFVVAILVPCMIFRFAWLCPDANDQQALAAPQNHSALSFVLAVIFALVLTGVAKGMNSIKGVVLNWLAFLAVSLILLVSLVLCRIHGV